MDDLNIQPKLENQGKQQFCMSKKAWCLTYKTLLHSYEQDLHELNYSSCCFIFDRRMLKKLLILVLMFSSLAQLFAYICFRCCSLWFKWTNWVSMSQFWNKSAFHLLFLRGLQYFLLFYLMNFQISTMIPSAI